MADELSWKIKTKIKVGFSQITSLSSLYSVEHDYRRVNNDQHREYA